MKKRTLQTAIYEARRFIERAEIALKEDNLDYCCGSKVNAAAKRSSLDLTRTLADLRAGR